MLKKIVFIFAIVIFVFQFFSWAKQPGELNPESLLEIAAKEYDGRDLKIEKTLQKNKQYTRYLITYKSGKLKISGIMNVPKGKGVFPVIITNHGYINPKYYTVGRGLKREQDYLAKSGFVVIHPDYRNHGLSDKNQDSENALRLGYVEDVINLVYAIKESQYKFLDKENIGMLGHSLGGGICLNIMVTKPNLVKAYVLYAPVSADYIDNFNKWSMHREIGNKIITKYGSPDANSEFWKNLSAINFLDRVKAPIALHHAVTDKSCNIKWSDRLVKELKEKKKKAFYYRYPKGEHEFISNWPIFMQRSKEFFKKYL